MISRGANNFWKDKKGSTLIEFSLIMTLLFVVTFGILEGAYIAYQLNNAQKATQLGARYASTRESVVDLTVFEDCGADHTAKAGTACKDIPNQTDSGGNPLHPDYDGFDTVTCATPTASDCVEDAWNAVLAEMQTVYPEIEAANLEISFSYTGLGYVGRRKPVPAITVSLINMKYDYIVVGQILNLGNVINFPTTYTTVIAEDIGEGA